jgi:hypothetical protein
MPPPVVAALGERPVQHPLIAAQIADIGHICSSLFYRMGRILRLTYLLYHH